MAKTKIQVSKEIHIKGARANNLKDIELVMPKEKLIVVTGLSGSGKSSLVMDTLYAEGQRRYVESLSSYARQFLSRMNKPEIDFIKGIAPAIAVEQKVTTSNARSTVGSLTEIYDYLRLLYGQIGITYSPISGNKVKKDNVSDVVNFIKSLKKGTRVSLFIPLNKDYPERTVKLDLALFLQKGYSRMYHKKEIKYIEEVLDANPKFVKQNIEDSKEDIKILLDRFVVNDEEENIKRIADSIATAFSESGGEAYFIDESDKSHYFNNRFELDGIRFLEPTHQLFNYNNPYGACPTCEGYGMVLGIDPHKVIPNPSLSLYDGAIKPWKGEKMSWYLDQVILHAEDYGISIHKPYVELGDSEKELIWEGTADFEGINDFFAELESKTYKIQNRIMMARFRGRTKCSNCKGGRLRPETMNVKVADKTIQELIFMPLDQLLEHFKQIKLSKHDAQIAERILKEITKRLEILCNLGLSYLDLNRVSSTLSGGETQRINLTRTIGSNLTNSIYILDEPSIGLHPKDTEKLVNVLEMLRNLKNTVIVVEHEDEVIKAADFIVDIGPGAGVHGGELLWAGDYKKFIKDKKTKSLTKDYIKGDKEIPLPKQRRKPVNFIKLNGLNQHNLKNIDVKIPLNALTVVSGVSGSGKTTLVKHILFPALKRELGESTTSAMGQFDSMTGDYKLITTIEMINQNPIGKSSRSNPVTYVKAYDSIRKLFCKQQLSKIRGYKPKHFSFNTEGGRCENCKGDGHVTVEMQFLADIKLLCEDCKGSRFKDEILEVKYNGKNVSEVLNMSVLEAIEFFGEVKDVVEKIKPLYDVGLGYIKMGQPSSTLSGGEAQRVKLASYLGKSNSEEHIFFIFDEPTTGLHFHDINKLLSAMQALIEKGHSVLIVEHNMDVIKSADWLIDLGPDGGIEGGNLLYQGTPEGLLKVKGSHTGEFLKEKL